ncbi:GspE/PulE family protein [Gemmatimonas phototrophica]|uniref:GspE/PulE family protein n=1 Tax=Gemmatimonas phototrophica TaxID=1379270 RepID=UPI0006A74BE0|nr:GspE/PulE family protein [Gemmatimonas phototrophica]
MTDARDLRAAAAEPLARRFPARWLEEQAVLPLSLDGTVARVAADGMPPLHVLDALERTLGASVEIVPAGAGDIRAALVAIPRDTPAATAETLAGDVVESLDSLKALANREPVVQVVNAMLAEALRAGASDIHVETRADGVRIRMRLDGVLRDVQQLGQEFRAAVVSRIKVLAGLDIAERRLPQDGRARVRVGQREMDIRISTLPALHGESIVLRLLDGGEEQAATSTPLLLDALGMADATREALRALLHRSSGLVLVTGPTGSGKTTTLYAALRERSAPGVKVVTVEDPVEYRLDDVVQLPVNTRAGFGFAEALRAILRHDPDVILVGEMRDAETAEIAVRAALTGHLVLSTVHTTDAIGALARLRDMGVPAYLLTATLQGVVAQRLVRRVCRDCGAWRAVLPEERALLGNGAIPEKVCEGRGCDRCSGTGYRGRLAIVELMTMTDALREQFTRGDSSNAMRQAVRALGVSSLRDDGVRLVREGQTTVAELTRVLNAGDEG